ncbi:hypothetical protein [Thiohalobacter thiocyanaticus]|uniref:hypothetical protein n=1 Tax=Thiohalobacter thiocyanaticus TaxID=585455 RepID=UPI001F4D3DD6|nr:hypothetical protein [Thiohalobacter thiocyanaticus]
MHEYDGGGTVSLGVGSRQFQMAGELMPGRCGALRVIAVLLVFDGRDLGPHHGAIDAVVIQQGQSHVVVGVFQVFIQKAPGQIVMALVVEVHQQEGDLAQGVDPAQVGRELQAVEDLHPAVDVDHVGQMQITVAFPDPAFAAALLDVVLVLLELGFRPVPQRLELSQQGRVIDTGVDLVEVFPDAFGDALESTVAAVRRGRRQTGVELRQGQGQLIDVRGGQFILCCQPVQAPRVVELLHLEGVFDGCARAVELRVLRGAGYRNHIEIQLRRQAAVEFQFNLAVLAALFQGTEIEKAEIDRFLELVGDAAGEQDPGDMGFDHAEVTDRMRKAFGRLQRGYDSLQCGCRGAHTAIRPGARQRARMNGVVHVCSGACRPGSGPERAG